jgi:peroxiredoxin
LSSGCAAQRRVDERVPAAPEIGGHAPMFSRIALGGERISVPAKTPMLVIFFATWSEPDMKLVTRMQEVAETFPPLTVLGVGIDDEDRGLLDAARSRGARYPIVWDREHTLAQAYKLESDPETFVIDPSGVIRFIHRGYRDGDADEMEAEIASLVRVDVCSRPLPTNDGPACFRHCARLSRAEARCASSAEACRQTCAHDNAPRNAALAVCRRKRPSGREACEAVCHGEEMSAAIDACSYHSANQPALREECEATCGIGHCRASCRP